MNKNLNQVLIDKAVALAAEIEKLTPRDGNTAMAIGAAHTIRDQLTWHGESALERAAAAAEAAKTAKANPPVA